MKEKLVLHKCGKCEYSWQGRVKKPKQCPFCKFRLWSFEDVENSAQAGKEGKP